MSEAVVDLVGELERLGVRLYAAGDKVRYRPREIVPPELVERMRAAKPALLNWLIGNGFWVPSVTVTPDDLSPEWRERYKERIAIMEYDAYMTRPDAEAFALADIIKLMRSRGAH